MRKNSCVFPSEDNTANAFLSLLQIGRERRERSSIRGGYRFAASLVVTTADSKTVIRAAQAHVLDTTGAGDVFVIAMLLHGRTYNEAARVGGLLAARSVVFKHRAEPLSR